MTTIKELISSESYQLLLKELELKDRVAIAAGRASKAKRESYEQLDRQKAEAMRKAGVE